MYIVLSNIWLMAGAFAEDTELSKEFLMQAESLREFYKFAIVRDPDLLKVIGQTK